MLPSKAKRILLSVTVFFAVFLLVCTFLSRTIYNGYLPVVQVIAPTSSTLPHTVQTEGVLVYLDKQTLRAAADWQVVEVFSQSGMFVQEGTPLFSIDTAPFEIRRLQLAIALEQAESQALQELLAAELALHLQTFPADGIVKAEAGGRLLFLGAKPGETLAFGAEAAVWVEGSAPLFAEIRLSHAEGRIFAKGDGGQITLAESSERRAMVYVSQTAYVRKAEADDAGVRLYFPIESESAREGDTAYVTMTKSLGDYVMVVPLKTILARNGLTGYAYITGTRPGLFGEESYVELVQVEVIAENRTSAAVDVKASLPQNAEFVLTTNRTLEPGGAVWVKR